MNAFRYLAVNARPLSVVFNQNFMKNRNVVRIGQSNRNMMGETYEGSGKTTGYILNKRGIDVICIDYISTQGFKLTNGWSVMGATVFFPHTLIGWKVKNLLDINEDSLALFEILAPKVDCIFIGYGCKKDMTYTKIRELLSLCKKMNLNVEILETERAAAAFNFCSLDRRFVAAALIPPQQIQLHDLVQIEGPKETIT